MAFGIQIDNSGFAWNESTNVFNVEDEVWVDLIKVNMTPLAIYIVNPQLTFKLK